MNNNHEWLGPAAGTILTAVQTHEVFQIISLILTILTTFITFAFTIYKWVKAAKADGKIDANEIEQGIEIIEDLKEDLDKISEEFNEKE